MRATIAVRRAPEHRWTHLSLADSQRALRAANAAASRWMAPSARLARGCRNPREWPPGQGRRSPWRATRV